MRKYLFSLLLALFCVVPTTAEAQYASTKTISTAGADCSVATNCALFGVNDMPSLGIYVNVATSGIFVFEATIDGTIWFGINDDVGAAGTATADGAFFFSNPGYAYIRLRASAINGEATIVGFKGYSGLKSTATLSGASQGDGAILDGASAAIKATVSDLANSNPLTTAIVDADGTQITSFGGGTQYPNGEAQAAPTGTVALGWDGTSVRALTTDAIGNLQVEFPTAQAVTQSGTWNIGSITSVPSHPVTNAGTFAVQAAQSGTWNIGSITTLPALATGANVIGAVTQSGTWNVANTGTFATQAAQSGTWTVQPGNTANTTPWLATISQGGNSAAVNASGQLSITCANCSGSGASFVDDAAFTVATSSGAPAMGLADETSADSVDEGDVGALRMTLARILKVTLTDASGTAVSVGTDYTHDAALTVASTSGPATVGRAVTSLPTAVGAADDAVLGAFSTQGQQLVAPTAIAFGGASNHYTTSAATTNATSVKGSAGTIYDISVINTTATLYYLRLYNTAAAPTCSSATGFVESIPIPASTTGAGISRTFPVGRAYGTGIGFCLTGGGADTDNTSAATGVYISIGYK